MNPWRWVDHRIEAVSVADLRAYLTGRGWKVAPNPNVHLERFECAGERR